MATEDRFDYLLLAILNSQCQAQWKGHCTLNDYKIMSYMLLQYEYGALLKCPNLDHAG